MHISESEWALAHAWVHSRQRKHFANLIDAAAFERIEASLPARGIARARLLRHCAAVEQSDAPEPASAEAFLEESGVDCSQAPKRRRKARAMPGDKAARDAAAALNLRGEVGAIAAVRKEARRKLRGKSKPRHRRNWKLLPPAKRRVGAMGKHKAEQAGMAPGVA